MLKITFVLLVSLISAVEGASHQRIDTLGMSPKGQYVAVEEYGYQPHGHSFYVTIKILNVWKKEFVGQPIELRVRAMNNIRLPELRLMAKAQAEDILKKYNIVSILQSNESR